jgi:hypothetical protein
MVDVPESRLRVYFRVLRSQVGCGPIPSRLCDEISVIAKSANGSGDPAAFLLGFGLVFFGDCCVLNVALLARAISSSKSRVSAALQREGWALRRDLLAAVAPRLRQLNLDPRCWSPRDYPPGSRLRPAAAADPPPPEAESPARDDAQRDLHDAELTLHVDIFSWTGFDDADMASYRVFCENLG